MIDRRRFLQVTALTGAAVLLDAQAQSQRKSARVIVGFPPGASSDVIARTLAERLRGSYAATITVENRPGAAGAIAVAALMKEDPDGGTLYVAPESILSLYPHVYRKLPYEPERDLLPVSLMATNDWAFAVHSSLGVSSLKDFLEWSRANAKKAFYGTLGSGTSPHFLGFLFSSASGAPLTAVNYKGVAPGMQDFLAGQIPAYIGPVGDLAPHHRGGRVRALAVASPQRSRFLPDVPTFGEGGYPTVLATDGFAVYLRAGSTPATVDAVASAVRGAVESAEFRQVLERIGYDARYTTPPEFRASIKREYDRWKDIVAASGFKAD
jgi:tripartite-type tricarboxylate transporter receptor subunit TctC